LSTLLLETALGLVVGFVDVFFLKELDFEVLRVGVDLLEDVDREGELDLFEDDELDLKLLPPPRLA
jgi:hypothetical protein